MKTNKVRLELLKDSGFRPQGILDIGAHIGKWSLMAHSVFPDTPILMVEGNTDNSDKIDDSLSIIKRSSPKSGSYMQVLSDKEKNITYYKPKQGGTSGVSIYRENTVHYSESNVLMEKRKALTLDQLLNGSDSVYDFIKLDVQGSEKDIINGAKLSIKKARFILLEAQLIEYNDKAPLANEIISTLSDIGFMIADIYELHYLPDGRLNEIDFLFARKNDPMLDIYHKLSVKKDKDNWMNYDICIAKNQATKKKSFVEKLIAKFST